jgi:hypothetical protein
MSISFFFDGDDQSITLYTCVCERDGRGHPACRDCKGTGQVTISTDLHQVNITNTGAYELAHALDIPGFDDCGEIAAKTLRDLCDDLRWVARTRIPVAYARHKIRELRQLAAAALARGAEVVHWG